MLSVGCGEDLRRGPLAPTLDAVRRSIIPKKFESLTADATELTVKTPVPPCIRDGGHVGHTSWCVNCISQLLSLTTLWPSRSVSSSSCRREGLAATSRPKDNEITGYPHPQSFII